MGLYFTWLIWLKIFILVGIIFFTIFNQRLTLLRNYFIILFILVFFEWVFFTLIRNLTAWYALFGVADFTFNILGGQLLKLGLTSCMFLALLSIKKRPREFFLTLGDLKAPAKKVGKIINEGTPWNKMGVIIALIIGSGVVAFLFIFNFNPSMNFSKIFGYLPLILLFASTNAFSEEFSYRCSFLSTSKDALPRIHSLLLSAAYFGIAHYYGVPYGITGALMSTFLGWLLGKSVLETKGLFWAWFIHLVQDIIIFTFLAAILG